jgi:hypothetical protein
MSLTLVGSVLALLAAFAAIVVTHTIGLQEGSYTLLWAIWLHVVANGAD